MSSSDDEPRQAADNGAGGDNNEKVQWKAFEKY